MSRYVTIAKFSEQTGYSQKAVRCKIDKGVWAHGREFRRAPDGHILIDMEGYQRWVEGLRGPLSPSGTRSGSSSPGRERAA